MRLVTICPCLPLWLNHVFDERDDVKVADIQEASRGTLTHISTVSPPRSTSDFILVNPMSAWCHSHDAQAAKDEINTEIVRQGWDRVGKTSSKRDKDIARDQKLQFASHLADTYPDAAKKAPSWLQFIQTAMGVLKEWNSVAAETTQTRRTALSDARVERKAGTRLSPDSRAAQGLDPTPNIDKLLARQVTEH